MSPTVELTPETFARLQGLAVPFVDNHPESVIKRVLDFFEKHQPSNGSAASAPVTDVLGDIRKFSPVAPPDLTHTKVISISFCGKPWDRSKAKWNTLLYEAVQEAKRRAKSNTEFKRLVTVNYVEGQKSDEGYRYLPDAGISVQGQDANSSWRAACHIAQEIGCQLEVTFAWRHKEAAAYPGVTGQFSIAAK